MSQPAYLIDASIYIFRAYFSLPDQWHSPEGYSVNALCGYIQFLLQFLQKTQAKYLAAAFDESLGSCFRNEIYPDYKSSRVLPDEALAFQLSACKSFTEIMGINTLASERYEADDLIATMARLCREHKKPVCIVTKDKDLGQLLIGEEDTWWDFSSDKVISKKTLSDYFGVHPNQVVDYLALVGDTVDDIPGVPGIGVKTAATLLRTFESVQCIYSNIDALQNSSIRGAKNIAQKLLDYREQINMAQQLVRLESNAVIGSHYQQLLWKPPEKNTLRYFLQEFGLEQRFERQLSRSGWW